MHKNVEALILLEKVRASRQTPVTGVSQADDIIKDTKKLFNSIFKNIKNNEEN
jgi:hypothetical protein